MTARLSVFGDWNNCLKGWMALCWLALPFPAMLFAQTEDEDLPDHGVVVLANSASETSLRIAAHYMQARRLPQRCLVTLELPEAGEISRADFTEKLWNPLLRQLIETEWMEAQLSAGFENHGRLVPVLIENRVKYLAVCYGVPYSVSEAEGLDDAELIGRLRRLTPQLSPVPSPRMWNQSKMNVTRASVDSELALLALPYLPLAGAIASPVYGNLEAFRESQNIIAVSRLDGPDEDSIRRMIDRTIVTEREGLRGRAYFDQDGRGGAYGLGNRWIDRASTMVKAKGWDTDVDLERRVLPYNARFDSPAIYAGWYAGNLTGAFSREGLEFPPGALAFHIHSYSARDLRSPDKGWTGPLVARGVCGTIGNTSEPFLVFTHDLEKLFHALLQGASFGEATTVSLHGFSWQTLAVGDPLYRPFQHNLELQLADQRTDLLSNYVWIRRANLLVLSDRLDEAASTLQTRASARFRQPDAAPLHWRLAEIHRLRNDPEGERAALRMMTAVSASPEYWPILIKGVERLNELKAGADALVLIRELIDEYVRQDDERWGRSLYTLGIRIAKAEGALVPERLWENRLMVLEGGE